MIIVELEIFESISGHVNIKCFQHMKSTNTQAELVVFCSNIFSSSPY